MTLLAAFVGGQHRRCATCAANICMTAQAGRKREMLIARILAMLTLSFAVVSGAQAHVTLGQTSAPANSNFRAVFGIEHGCSGQPTTAIRIRLDERITEARPMPKPGWKVEVVHATRKRPDGSTLTAPTEIAWSGGSLPADFYDEFLVLVKLPKADVGTVLYFPVVQECGGISTRWIETPLSGEDPDTLSNPAPSVTLTAPSKDRGGDS
jgi:uncharacterized protein YcnI